MSDDKDAGSHDPPAPPRERANGADLPPPAFPPGSRRVNVPRSEPGGMSDAFISPDDPIPERDGVPESAFTWPDAPFPPALHMDVPFISPDDPIPHREPRSAALAHEASGGDDALDLDDVVVTGIGDDTHLDPTELAFEGDQHVRELVELVGRLAQALRQRGEAGLRHTPGLSRFESTLRAYCVGYLAGRRAEDEWVG